MKKHVDRNSPLYAQLFTPETKMRCASQFAKNHFGNKKVEMVEVGTLRGDYADLMLKEWPQIEKIHLIDMFSFVWDIPDPFEHEENYNHVTKRFNGNEKVNLIVGDSVKSAEQFKDKSLDFVYIDANHLYESVKADILAWLPKIKSGGIIGGHDYDYSIRPSVKEAVDEIFKDKVKSGVNQNTLEDWWAFA